MTTSDASGLVLNAVTYYESPSLAVEDCVRHRHFHSVGMAIELSMNGGRVFCAYWHMRGIDEAWVGFEERRANALIDVDYFTAMDATGWPEYRPHIGMRIDAVTEIRGPKPLAEGATQVGVRLGFSGRAPVTIVVGQPDGDGGVEYQPDNLVVIFDATMADAYIADLNEGGA